MTLYDSSLLSDGTFAYILQITFPNGVFSGTILASVVPSSDIVSIAEWQLLLGIIAIPGVFVGAYLCDKIGRKNTMMLGFSGYRKFP